MHAFDAALRAEWLKSRTIPDTMLFGLGAVVLGVGWAVFPALMNRTRWVTELASSDAPEMLGPLFWLGVTRLSIIVAVLIGAILVTGDRGSGTAVVTRTVLTKPVSTYSAKVAIAASWGFIAGFITGAAIPLGLRILLGAAVHPITTAPSVMFGYAIRVGIISALCAALGVGLAALTRSLLATTLIAFIAVWFENTIASLFGDFAHLGVLTPWRNLTYFIDQQGYGLPFLWSHHWGFLPLAVSTAALVVLGAWRHRSDTNTIKE